MIEPYKRKHLSQWGKLNHNPQDKQVRSHANATNRKSNAVKKLPKVASVGWKREA